MAPTTRGMTGNEENNPNINQNIETSNCIKTNLQGGTCLWWTMRWWHLSLQSRWGETCRLGKVQACGQRETSPLKQSQWIEQLWEQGLKNQQRHLDGASMGQNRGYSWKMMLSTSSPQNKSKWSWPEEVGGIFEGLNLLDFIPPSKANLVAATLSRKWDKMVANMMEAEGGGHIPLANGVSKSSGAYRESKAELSIST